MYVYSSQRGNVVHKINSQHCQFDNHSCSQLSKSQSEYHVPAKRDLCKNSLQPFRCVSWCKNSIHSVKQGLVWLCFRFLSVIQCFLSSRTPWWFIIIGIEMRRGINNEYHFDMKYYCLIIIHSSVFHIHGPIYAIKMLAKYKI